LLDSRARVLLTTEPSKEARYGRAMVITSVLDIQLRADAPADAETRVSAVLSQTRARPGFLSADVVRDLEDPRHLVVIEVWESVEADDAYRAWRATPEGANELRELTAGRLGLKRYESTSI
jgi:quinol monooxygenase YgiN